LSPTSERTASAGLKSPIGSHRKCGQKRLCRSWGRSQLRMAAENRICGLS